MDPKAELMMGHSPYAWPMNNPISYNDPEGDIAPLVLVALGAAVINGGINVASQALKGNVTNFWQGLEYFGVGAAAGVAYVVPGGGVAIAGTIQAGGNKIVQAANGQWDLSDIKGVGDVAGLALDVGLDFAAPALGANLGKGLANKALIPLAENLGWITTASGGGSVVKIGGAAGDFAFAVGLDDAVTVTAGRASSGLARGIGSVAGKGGTKLLGTQGQNLRAAAQNPKLQNIVKDLYRPNARIASGSSMDAFRYEKLTGELVGGKSHAQKLLDYRRGLQKLWRNGRLSPGDRQITKQLLGDIQNALSGL